MTMNADKAGDAFRTIGELAAELGIPQHILRYWETRFPQLRPLQRAGNRRYYRPADVALAQRINRLLNQEGYTIRGVQQLLATRGADGETPPGEGDAPATPVLSDPALPDEIRRQLEEIRHSLAQALEQDLLGAR